jgi:hypothetical protein
VKSLVKPKTWRLAGLAAVAFVGLVAGSVDWSFGDLRYSVADVTIRHWAVVPMVKVACAHGGESGGFPCGNRSYTFTGPANGSIGVATSNYTVQPASSLASSVTVTPADSSHHGIFTPTTVSMVGGGSQTFTYTPLQPGNYSLSTTNNGGLPNPAAISFAVPNLLTGYPTLSDFSSSFPHFTVTGGQSDPFGGSNATSLTEDTSNARHELDTPCVSVTAIQAYTVALVVKQSVGTRGIEVDLAECGGSAAEGGSFNTSTGAVNGTFNFGGATAPTTSASSAGLASGWNLVTVKGSVGNFTSAYVAILTDSGTFADSYAGDGVSTILVYGPVLQ